MARNRKGRKRSEKPSEHILEISELGWHGDGLAEVDAKRVFVPFALKGETVRAMVTGNKARVIEVLDAAPERAEPICPHFGLCGGCAAQHLSESFYKDWKRESVATALSNRDIVAPVADLIDAHGAGRRRVTLHVRYDGGKAQAGFMQAGSHRLIDLDHCPVLAPDLQDAAVIARDFANALAKASKPLDIQLTATETGLDCAIHGAASLDLDARMDVSDCAERHDLARVTIGEDLVLERRAPQLTFDAAKVTIPSGGFLQATLEGEETLARLVLDGVGKASKVADLYCGIGPFSLRLTTHCQVLAFDNDEGAIAALNHAAHRTQGQKPVSAAARDLVRNPLHFSELKDFDAVVIDPPRAGGEAQSIELAQSRVKTIVSVSCNPASFAQDASVLIDGGYRLETVAPVDQFRYAGHVELVGIFSRPE